MHSVCLLGSVMEPPSGPPSEDQQAVEDLRELKEALYEADMDRLKSPKTPRKVSNSIIIIECIPLQVSKGVNSYSCRVLSPHSFGL